MLLSWLISLNGSPLSLLSYRIKEQFLIALSAPRNLTLTCLSICVSHDYWHESPAQIQADLIPPRTRLAHLICRSSDLLSILASGLASVPPLLFKQTSVLDLGQTSIFPGNFSIPRYHLALISSSPELLSCHKLWVWLSVKGWHR